MAITKIGTTGISNNLDVPGYLYLSGDNKELRFYNGANYMILKASGSLSNNYTITLPVDDGTSGQFLKTDGGGVLSWDAAGGGTAVAGTTDNGILTFVNSGSTFAAEANLTFDGTDLTVGTGNVVIGTADKGIDFSASSHSTLTGVTSQAELLNDYEHGIFTPTIIFSSANAGLTYTEQSGNYTKIGDRVFYMLRLRIADTGSSASTGSLYITGLPYVVGSGTRGYGAQTIYQAGISGTGTVACYNAVGEARFDIRSVNDSGVNVDTTKSQVANGTTLHISGHYTTRAVG